MRIVKDKAFEKALRECKATPEYDLERIKIEITESLVQAMADAGVSNAQLAERLGTSRAYITKILQGDVNFTLQTLVRISRALGATLTIPEFQIDKIDSKKSSSPTRKTASAKPATA